MVPENAFGDPQLNVAPLWKISKRSNVEVKPLRSTGWKNTKVKKFKCSLCGTEFTTKYRLKDHVQTKHDVTLEDLTQLDPGDRSAIQCEAGHCLDVYEYESQKQIRLTFRVFLVSEWERN